jgi:hypothetical protein
LHTVTVSLQGNVSVSESVEVNDAEALPLFIRLKAVLQSEEPPRSVRRGGRPRTEKRTDDGSTVAAAAEVNPAALPQDEN